MSLTAKKLEKHIRKALDNSKKPLDLKASRKIIEMLHEDLTNSHVLWDISNELLMMVNPYSAWKFCNLLHKVLHFGHPVLTDEASQLPQRTSLHNGFNNWHGKGHFIINTVLAFYYKALITKMEYHNSYNFFNGDMQLCRPIYEDLDLSFQVCLDMFDVFYDFLTLAEIVFLFIEPAGRSSYKCYLMPLITVHNECNALYEQLLNCIRALSAQLPLDYMTGFYDRFSVVHRRFLEFSRKACKVKYLKKFITTTNLMETLPNLCAPSQCYNAVMPTAPMEIDIT